jgi:hypothetical protein
MKTLITLFCSLFVTSFALAQTCPNKVAETTPSQDFSINGDGTVTHLTSGLMWSQCSLGQQWLNNQCIGDALELDWAIASEQVKSVQLAGFNDWRLPDINEIETIVERSCYDPAINLTVFPQTPSLFYWSATPDTYGPGAAWRLFFHYGDVYYYSYKFNLSAVRLVRNAN